MHRQAKDTGQTLKAANDEAKANLIIHDVILGHKDIGDVPLELLANVKKVLEKRMAKLLTQSTTTSSCVSYEFYYFILIVAHICILIFECMCHTRAHGAAFTQQLTPPRANTLFPLLL